MVLSFVFIKVSFPVMQALQDFLPSTEQLPPELLVEDTGHVSRPMRPLGRGPCTVNVGEEYCIPFNDIFGPITWPKLVKILLETGVVFEI